MNTRSRQQGLTMWGMLFVISVIAFVVFMILKLFPPYKDDFKVKAAFNSVARQGVSSKQELLEMLGKRFDIDDISHVSLNDLKFETRGRMRVLRLDYEVEVPMVGNLYVLLKFDHEQQVASGE